MFPVGVEHHLRCIFDLGVDSMSKCNETEREGAYHSSASGIRVALDEEVHLYQSYYSTRHLLHARAALEPDVCHPKRA